MIGTLAWSRCLRALEVGTLAASAVIAAVELLAVLRADPVSAGGLVALAAAVTGIAFYRHVAAVSIALVAAAPLAATTLHWNPTGAALLAAATALLLPLRGVRALPAGVLIALAVLAAGAAPLIAVAAVAAAAAGSSFYSHARELLSDADAARAAALRDYAEERLRMACELRDNMDHRITALTLHLGSAQESMSTDPAAAEADLESARTVLAETRRLLRILEASATR